MRRPEAPVAPATGAPRREAESAAPPAEPEPRSPGAGDLGTRLAVAAVGIPLCVGVTWIGGLPFAIGLGVLAGIAAWEFARMLRGRGIRVAVLALMAASSAFPPTIHYLGPSGAWYLAIVVLLAAGTVSMLRVPPAEGPIRAAGYTVFGALYLGGLLGLGVPLRGWLLSGRADGTLLFLMPVAVTWVADTAAFAVGRRFGRRRLAPHISPNKTVAGGVAAIASGPPTAVVYVMWLLPDLADGLGIAMTLLLGLVIAVAAVLGDLVESALKRECGVKDASRLLPGHGGLLDRMDSLLWSIPVTYLFLRGWP